MNKEQRHSSILKLIDLNSGEGLLSTRTLAVRFGVSEMTIRRDLQELSENGLIHRQHGGATPVKSVQSAPTLSQKKAGILLTTQEFKYTDPFFNVVLESAERRLTELGYRIAYVYGYEDIKNVMTSQRFLEDSPVDGVLLIGTYEHKNIEIIKSKVPVMVSVTDSWELEHDSILFHGRTGMRQMVQHLASLGRQRLGFVIGKTSHHDARIDGFMEGLALCGLDDDPELRLLNLSSDWSYELGAEAASMLMNLDNPPDSIVCASDRLAIGALNWLHQHGYRVPDDIAVTGFDNIKDSAFTVPPLTTVNVHKQLMGQLAAERLDRRLEKPDELPLTIVTPTELVIRQSCGYQLQHKSE